MFEEKKPLKDILEEMKKELQETKSEEPDPFAQLFSKKSVELPSLKKKRKEKKGRAKKKTLKPKKTKKKQKTKKKSKKKH